jgi:diguanylate cyclase (GGDEF)-like protein
VFKSLPERLSSLRDKATLGQQMGLVAALLCLVLVASASISAALIARQQTKARVEAEMTTLASNMAERLDMRMFERLRDVRNLAAMEPLRRIWEADDASDARSVLEQLQASLSEYTWIGFATADGTVKAATSGMLEANSVAARPWFKQGLQGPTAQDVHDAKLLAGLLGPSPDNAPFRFVDVAVPVNGSDGRVVGVLGAHMSWTWATAVRRAVLDTVDRDLQTEIWVLAQDGTALLGPGFGSRPLDAATLERIRSSGRVTLEDPATGTMMAAVAAKGYLDYPGLGWTVIARRPLDLAMAPANNLAIIIMLVGLGVAVAGVFVAAGVTHRLTRPLCQLAERVDQIGRSPNATMVELKKSSKDVMRLSLAIRSLLRRVMSAEAMQDQTLEVRAANEALTAENRALQVLADTDALTGLLNRRAFRDLATDAMAYHRRYRRPLGVLMIDIDHFKAVNDEHGHAFGDLVIHEIGKILLLEARSLDKVARIGGEEFVVLLRDTEETGPELLSERIRARIANAVMQGPDAQAVKATVSIGAALAGAADRDIDDVIERADKALYEAKSRGRNRVVVAHAEIQTAAA